jgi:hypothetical protein
MGSIPSDLLDSTLEAYSISPGGRLELGIYSAGATFHGHQQAFLSCPAIRKNIMLLGDTPQFIRPIVICVDLSLIITRVRIDQKVFPPTF